MLNNLTSLYKLLRHKYKLQRDKLKQELFFCITDFNVLKVLYEYNPNMEESIDVDDCKCEGEYCIEECWMNEYIDEYMNECLDEYINGCLGMCMDGCLGMCMDENVDGCTNENRNECMDNKERRCTNEPMNENMNKNGCTNNIHNHRYTNNNHRYTNNNHRYTNKNQHSLINKHQTTNNKKSKRTRYNSNEMPLLTNSFSIKIFNHFKNNLRKMMFRFDTYRKDFLKKECFNQQIDISKSKEERVGNNVFNYKDYMSRGCVYEDSINEGMNGDISSGGINGDINGGMNGDINEDMNGGNINGECVNINNQDNTYGNINNKDNTYGNINNKDNTYGDSINKSKPFHNNNNRTSKDIKSNSINSNRNNKNKRTLDDTNKTPTKISNGINKTPRTTTNYTNIIKYITTTNKIFYYLLNTHSLTTVLNGNRHYIFKLKRYIKNNLILIQYFRDLEVIGDVEHEDVQEGVDLIYKKIYSMLM